MFRGNLYAYDIFEDVCSNFKNPPKVCYNVLGIEDESL